MAVADYKAASMSLKSTSITNNSCYGFIENFEIEKQIGKGQFSEVFRAKCMIDNRTVALKRIKVNLIQTEAGINYFRFLFFSRYTN
jgi:serine/threonine protein kinase